ncbi:MAG: hypothetical protein ACYDCL_08875 [Myxococcales bacterium]
MRSSSTSPSVISSRLLIAGLALGASSLAAALNVPTISGHLTDPGRKLSGTAKSALEDRLTGVADDTHVDVAGWISDAPEDQADALGRAFYRRWNIGGEWDSGVFFMFPATGPVHIILEPGRPKLSPAEVAQLVAEDRPGTDWQGRVEHLIDVTRRLILPKTIRVRPWGPKRPEQAIHYAIGALALAAAATALSVRRRAKSSRS